MSESSQGQIITFYSYKGGVGRSMAVANCAAQLAQRGDKTRHGDLCEHHDVDLIGELDDRPFKNLVVERAVAAE